MRRWIGLVLESSVWRTGRGKKTTRFPTRLDRQAVRLGKTIRQSVRMMLLWERLHSFAVALRKVYKEGLQIGFARLERDKDARSLPSRSFVLNNVVDNTFASPHPISARIVMVRERVFNHCGLRCRPIPRNEYIDENQPTIWVIDFYPVNHVIFSV